MQRPVVSGGAVVSRVLLVGQAPGDKEPVLGRPFAWTAGKKLFRWFHEHAGVDEAVFRSRVYMAAVCRCFPGKKATGGDRVPDPDEIANCSGWLAAEMALLRPHLVIAVGKLAIAQFVPCVKLETVIGQVFSAEYAGHRFDLVPLPHPSGASPWPHQEQGRVLLPQAMRLIAKHPAWKESVLLQSSLPPSAASGKPRRS
jgi:uracil-DNA glycosylase